MTHNFLQTFVTVCQLELTACIDRQWGKNNHRVQSVCISDILFFVVLSWRYHNNHTIPDRSPPGSTRTAPSAVHQDGGVKHATGASSKIRGRDNITTGTWNTRALRAAGKLQELTHEMDRYRWNILGLCKMRWKNFGETTTEEGHKVFFSGKEDKHEHGVGFLVHKDIVNTVMGCRPVSSRLITIRLRAISFNITKI